MGLRDSYREGCLLLQIEKQEGTALKTFFENFAHLK